MHAKHLDVLSFLLVLAEATGETVFLKVAQLKQQLSGEYTISTAETMGRLKSVTDLEHAFETVNSNIDGLLSGYEGGLTYSVSDCVAVVALDNNLVAIYGQNVPKCQLLAHIGLFALENSIGFVESSADVSSLSKNEKMERHHLRLTTNNPESFLNLLIEGLSGYHGAEYLEKEDHFSFALTEAGHRTLIYAYPVLAA